jgi:hypothetical protein
VTCVHPLAAVLDASARGDFPSADGAVDVLPPDGDSTRAVVAMTGHAFVLADIGAADLARLMGTAVGGFGAALMPAVLTWLADGDRTIGSTDVVLVAAGTGGATSVYPTTRYDDHQRVLRARAHRRDVAVYGDAHGVAIVGRGLVGRTELAVELFDQRSSSQRAGRRLIAAGLAAVPAGEWCWAQVAAGNARSLRAFLACGFRPICAEVLITRQLECLLPSECHARDSAAADTPIAAAATADDDCGR